MREGSKIFVSSKKGYAALGGTVSTIYCFNRSVHVHWQIEYTISISNMHLNYNQESWLICYEIFNENVVAKPCLSTLTCCNILTKVNGCSLDTYNEIYASLLKMHTQLYIFALD